MSNKIEKSNKTYKNNEKNFKEKYNRTDNKKTNNFDKDNKIKRTTPLDKREKITFEQDDDKYRKESKYYVGRKKEK